MANPKRIEVNCSTGETIEIELTDEEVAQLEADQLAAQTEQAALEAQQLAKATAKASALAKLEALGLTPEEAAAL